MAQDAEIGIHGRQKLLLGTPLPRPSQIVPIPYFGVKIILRPLVDIEAIGQDVDTEKFDALSIILKMDFFRMKVESESSAQKIPDLRDAGFEIVPV